MNKESSCINLFDENVISQGNKTIIVFGCARGGTSMVAGVIRMLHIDLGINLPNNHEDQNFVGKPIEHYINSIDSNNNNKSDWGWKNPNAANYLEQVKHKLRNPYLIVVYRDLISTTSGHIRYHRREPVYSLDEVLRRHLQNLQLVYRWRVPSLLISYEKSILNPTYLINDLTKFLQVTKDVDYEKIKSFMKPGKYKDIL